MAAGEYSISGMDVNACPISIDFTIEQPAPLEVSAVITDAFFGDNGNINLTVSGGVQPYEYLWSNGDEDNVANDIGQGTYSCTITDANNCTIDYTGNIIDLNVSELEMATFDIYPNPAKNDITISRNALKGTGTLVIFDALGRVVMTENILGQKHNFNVETLESGVYFIRVENEGTRKLIIE
ncbi:MAG: T9SS type A sorting domain-containing protein [Flavobacteriales bacterium]